MTHWGGGEGEHSFKVSGPLLLLRIGRNPVLKIFSQWIIHLRNYLTGRKAVGRTAPTTPRLSMKNKKNIYVSDWFTSFNTESGGGVLRATNK